MSLKELLLNRYSVRAFLPDPIPQTQLEEIFTTAQRAVSNCNVQPWENYVVSGEIKEKLKAEFMKLLMTSPKPKPDFEWGMHYEGKHRQRQFATANELYTAMGIAREDKMARQLAMARNWQFFDAPHAVFFGMEKYLGIMGAVDLGVYAQTLALLMQEQGISSCMQGALGQFPEPVRKILNIPDNIGILFGMSFGYEDKKAAPNQARTQRIPKNESNSFY